MRQHIIVGRLKIDDKESGVRDTYVFRAKRLKMRRYKCERCGENATLSSMKRPSMPSQVDFLCRWCKVGMFKPYDLFGIKLYVSIPHVVDGVRLLCGVVPVLRCKQERSEHVQGLWLKQMQQFGFQKWPKKRREIFKVFLDGGVVPAIDQLRAALETMEVLEQKKKMAVWTLVKVPTNAELTEVYDLYEKAKFAEVL